ncbi:unnamed protein product [Haemonchus placei]|uniref:Uncharacterized protein n=1 Tax=Haemonchus placei TaxID=6290 RepID=A0A3P7U2R8_HAEPC|nr:unnamed protein product [Haemonchus placei]
MKLLVCKSPENQIFLEFSSKYIGGHADVIGGCVTTRTLDQWKRLKLQQLTTGSALSPFDAALLARGLKTLPLRVDKICSNAHHIAQFLAKHPKVQLKYFYEFCDNLDIDLSPAACVAYRDKISATIDLSTQNGN